MPSSSFIEPERARYSRAIDIHFLVAWERFDWIQTAGQSQSDSISQSSTAATSPNQSLCLPPNGHVQFERAGDAFIVDPIRQR